MKNELPTEGSSRARAPSGHVPNSLGLAMVSHELSETTLWESRPSPLTLLTQAHFMTGTTKLLNSIFPTANTVSGSQQMLVIDGMKMNE